MVAKEKMAHIDVKHYSNMKRKDACDFFNAKPADKLKFTTLWDNTVSSWVCIIAESSKVMLLMWLKSSIESEIHPQNSMDAILLCKLLSSSSLCKMTRDVCVCACVSM